jgi:small conductance mechanosensitive channel
VFTAIWLLAIFLALQQQLQFDIRPVLAGAGVAGLAVGLAAQSVLKDWISGFFLLTEGRLRVNDVIKIGDLAGSVESLSLRTTVLRAFDGSAHVFSNGTISNFTNLTLGHAFAVFDIAVDYDEDPERLMAMMAEIGSELRQSKQFGVLILDAMEVAGVDRFTEQGVVVKARLKTLPGKQWTVGREVNRLLRLRCAEAGITIATAQRAVTLFEKGVSHAAHPGQPTGRS